LEEVVMEGEEWAKNYWKKIRVLNPFYLNSLL